MVPQIFAPPWAALGVSPPRGDLELATGIAMGFVRSPLETAMAALDLDKISGGRFTLGLGTSVREWNEDRFGVAYDRPLARLRELTVLVHRMTTASEQAEVGLFEGDFYTVDLRGTRLPRPVRPSIPIWLAPLRSPMVELSAEVADGLLGHPVWSPRWIKGEVQEAVARAWRAPAGRVTSSASWRSCAWPSATTSSRRRRTPRPASRCTPRSSSTTRTSPPTGSATRRRRCRRWPPSGAPYRDLAAAVTDEMAREFVIVGTPRRGRRADRRSPAVRGRAVPHAADGAGTRPDPGVRGRHRHPPPAPRRLSGSEDG